MDLTYNRRKLEDIKKQFVVESLVDKTYPDMAKYKHRYIVYMILNIKNGKKYVGSTTDFNQRINSYIYDILERRRNSNQPIVRAIREEGIENFIMFPIDSVENRDELRQREYEYIMYFRTLNPVNGYNAATPSGAPLMRKIFSAIHKAITKAGKSKFVADVNNTDKILIISEGMKLFADITGTTKDVIKNAAKSCTLFHNFYIIYLNRDDRTALYDKVFNRWIEVCGIRDGTVLGEKRGLNRAKYDQYLEAASNVTTMIEEESPEVFTKMDYSCKFLHYDLTNEKPYIIEPIECFFAEYDLSTFDI